MGDPQLEEVAHHIEFVPADVAEVRMAVDRVEGMDVAVGQLGREHDRGTMLGWWMYRKAPPTMARVVAS